MAHYVGLSVGIHGLAREEGEKNPTAEEVRETVDQLLREHFKPMYASDITVDLEESAG